MYPKLARRMPGRIRGIAAQDAEGQVYAEFCWPGKDWFCKRDLYVAVKKLESLQPKKEFGVDCPAK